MKIEMVEISELKPYENNPRINGAAVEYVMNSIKEFGFNVPFVIDESKVIVCGHTRYEALKNILKNSELDFVMVPCVIADDLSEEQIKAFRIADNKTHELSKWDYDLLHNELEGLGIDMSEFGFVKTIEGEFESEGNEQILDEGVEVDLGKYDDEQFEMVCPCCGFRFNEKK